MQPQDNTPDANVTADGLSRAHEPNTADEPGSPEAGAGSASDQHPALPERVRSAVGFLPGPVRWIVVAVVGGTLIIAGIAMLVLPGPGLLALFAGVAVLAAEFTWAEILLRRMKAAGEATWSLVRRRPRD